MRAALNALAEQSDVVAVPSQYQHRDSASGSGGGGISHAERGGQGASSSPGMRNETTPPSNGTTPRR